MPKTAWGPDDPRRTAVGFESWTRELEALLIAQIWAISLLDDQHKDMVPLIDAGFAIEPVIRLRRGPIGLDYVDLEVAPALAHIRTCAAANPRAYKAESMAAVVMIGVVSQLCDAAERLGLRAANREEPVFQYVHILRNALAHGLRFSIRGAARKSLPLTVGHITLTADLDDAPLVDIVGPGDIYELLGLMRTAVRPVLS
jgi:hypothetical protein